MFLGGGSGGFLLSSHQCSLSTAALGNLKHLWHNHLNSVLEPAVHSPKAGVGGWAAASTALATVPAGAFLGMGSAGMCSGGFELGQEKRSLPTA